MNFLHNHHIFCQFFSDILISLCRNKAFLIDFIDKNNKEKGIEEDMEIKTVDDLRKAYPDFVKQIETAAREDGVTCERTRMKEIDDLSGLVAEDAMKKAKYEEPVSSKDFAYEAIKANKALGNKALDDIKDDLDGSGAKSVKGGDQQETQEEKQKAKASNLAGFLNKDKRRAK